MTNVNVILIAELTMLNFACWGIFFKMPWR